VDGEIVLDQAERGEGKLWILIVIKEGEATYYLYFEDGGRQ